MCQTRAVATRQASEGVPVPIDVCWTATLAKRTRSNLARTSVDWRPGIRPIDVFLAEGFAEHDADAVAAVVNGQHADMDAALAESDRLEFLVNLAGG